MFAEVAVLLGMGVLVWAYLNVRPPPPKICGSPNGPPVTSPRIRLSDGRFLAYKERGVAKGMAKYKVIISHGFNSSKDLYLPLSQELMEELGIFVLTIDRPGYGESDPNPKRSLKSDAFDMEELADQLQLGPKFYVVGLSIGTFSTWGCLKYIPHRLAGVALVSPVINYWLPSLPSDLCNKFFRKLPLRDQLTFQIAHHAPALFWLLQKLLPSSNLMSLEEFMKRNPEVYRASDQAIFRKLSQIPSPDAHKVLQQGVHHSLHRDIIVFSSKWEFDPTELKNPFPENEGSVHLWQGCEDGMAPVQLQRQITQKLPWIQYHEVPDGGHLIIHDEDHCEAIFRALLL